MALLQTSALVGVALGAAGPSFRRGPISRRLGGDTGQEGPLLSLMDSVVVPGRQHCALTSGTRAGWQATGTNEDTKCC